MVIPEEDDVSFFNRQPDPLIMGIERPGSLLQHKRAGRVDPCTAGLGKASGLVIALYRQGGKVIRDLLQ